MRACYTHKHSLASFMGRREAEVERAEAHRGSASFGGQQQLHAPKARFASVHGCLRFAGWEARGTTIARVGRPHEVGRPPTADTYQLPVLHILQLYK